uniref:Uncharacterized protein n=1 Tax=Meloidogyne hapla TaxID=6305 RepID=A0A1I8B7D7_MELHA
MDVRLKLAELQKSRKRQLPIDESSEMVEQQHRPEVFYSDYEIDTLADHSFHPIINSTPVIFGSPPLQPSTPSMSTITIPRWELRLVRSPQYPITFWNVNERAIRSLAKTNNALESSHYHFVLSWRTSTSKWTLHALQQILHIRENRNMSKEAHIMGTLNEAEYDDDEQILNVLTLLGLQMSGYIDGLRTTARPEERDSEDSSDQPTSSISLII